MMETTALQRTGPQGPATIALPVLPKPTGFISTLEGNNLYAKYGPDSPEYLTAKARWQHEQIAKSESSKWEQDGFRIFQNEQFGELRVMKRGEEHWFVANDVCRVLELSNPRMAMGRLDEDEKGVSSIDTLGGKQEMAVVNEPGLYTLVLGSRKPEAKAFKRWITHEVIPSIRKFGGYLTPAKAEQRMDTRDAPIASRPESKRLEAEARLNNSRVRVAAEYRRIAASRDFPKEYRQALLHRAAEVLLGGAALTN